MSKPDKSFPNKAYRREQKRLAEKEAIKAESVFKLNAKTLKQFGFIDYDLRNPLSKYKINKIKKLIQSNNHIITSPELYVKRKVSKNTKDIWANRGYDTSSKYLIIPKNGFDKIHVSKDKITRRNYEKLEKIYSYKGLDLYQQLHRLEKTPLKQGEYITLKIGKNSAFQSRFYGVADLLKYISKWSPHDPKQDETRDDLISQMSIVKFTDFEEIRNNDDYYYNDDDDEYI